MSWPPARRELPHDRPLVIVCRSGLAQRVRRRRAGRRRLRRPQPGRRPARLGGRRPAARAGRGRSCSEQRRSHRHVLVGGRDADQDVVSRVGEDGRGPPAPLRRAVRHGRGELELLRAAEPGRDGGVGAADAAGVRVPREGVRDDDAPPGAARAAPGRPAGRRAGRRARPDRPSLARASRRGVHPLPGGARAAARGGQAGRDPDAVPVVHHAQAGVAAVPGVGEGAPRRRRDDGRVPPPQLARARERPRHARVSARARRDLRDGRRAAHRGPKPGADRRRHDLADRVPAPARPQRRHLERARPKRRRAVRLPLLARRARRSGPSRCASSRRSRRAPT